MHFVTGVVENVMDPMMLGRVQVRLNGVHSELKVPNMETGEGVTTESLPWGTPIQPITSAALDEKGGSPVGLLVGTWVMCMSPTPAYEVLFIMGSISGQKSVKEDGTVTNDINRLALGQDTSIKTKEDESGDYLKESLLVKTKTDNVYEAVDGTKEPVTPFAAQYPFNRVVESPNGIIVEMDDTEGSERIHVYHPSGTFIELHPDGVKVEKVVDKSYSVTMSDHNILVKGVINIIAEDDINIQTAKTCNIIAATDVNVEAEGNINTNSGADTNINVGGNGNIDIAGTGTISTGGNCTVDIGGTGNIKSSGTMTVESSGSTNIKAGSSCTVDATTATVKGTTVNVTAATRCTVKGSLGLSLKGISKSMNL